MNSSFSGYAVLGLSIGLGLFGGCYMASQAFKEVKLANETIEVKGVASENIMSDHGVWSTQARGTGATRVECYAALQATKAAIFAFLKEKGVDDKLITSGVAQLNAVYALNDKGQQTNQIVSYNGNLTVEVGSGDIKKIADLTSDANSLLEKGLDVEILQPRYIYTKLEDVKQKVLSKAARDAMNRADNISKSVGSKVQNLRSAKQGVFQITAVNSQDVSDYGYSDTSSAEKTIKAFVTMSFGVR